MMNFAGQCGRCFGETHIYAFYLDLVNGARDPPACSQHAATELCAMIGTSNCKRIGHFSIESHHCSGAILHSFCIFNRKIEKKLAFILPFAVTNHKQSQSPPQLGCHGCFLRDGLFVIAGVNGTVTEVGSLAAASAVARQALADADAAAGPGGLILGGIVLGLAVGYCCAACGKKKQDTKGYKPVTFNQE